MTTLVFTEEQIRALPEGTGNPDIRQDRFRKFDKAVFALFDTAIRKEGPRTDAQVAQVQTEVEATLMAHPETLAEMLCYTYEIDLAVTCRNSKYGSGWWWDRKYTYQKHMHMRCIFNPYDGSISAWTDYNDKTKIHHFL